MRGEINSKFFVFGILFLVSLMIVSANVGLGVSPSKIREEVTSGESYSYDYLVFNTGSQDINVKISVEGEISEFVTFESSQAVISPEPLPHEFPIKNGINFQYTIDFPKTMKPKVYTGKISVIGSGGGDSQFGGNVGVSTAVEYISIPPKSVFSKIGTNMYIFVAVLIALIALILILKKMGLKIVIKSKNKKPVKKEKSLKKKKVFSKYSRKK
jgi:hypothetical protein